MTFHVIDKRTGKEPIFDHNHIFKEKWFKESGLIWCDIECWYISEDGTLVLVDDCGKVAYPPIDRFDIVYDEPTVCDIEQIRAEIEQLYTVDTVYEDVVAVDKADVLRIIDKYTK
jgi:hypothetical protein